MAAEAASAGPRRMADRLVWEQPPMLRKKKWRRRKAAQRAAEAVAVARRSVLPEWSGRCFNCGQPGHRKVDCTNDTICLRCGLAGHEANGCGHPRSPDSEGELRRLALAKRARHEELHREAPNLLRAQPARGNPWPAPRVESAPSPALLHPPTQEADSAVPICVVWRSPAIQDLERRLHHAMVAHVGGARPAVSCAQVQEALIRQRGVPRGRLSVHSYRPEDFLVVFASDELVARVAAMPTVEHDGFSLFFRKWTR
ncbi:hypothetical protein QYE76_043365 [Lolium multiflorum]|uniref:CCHC-type domain-containing protein n=1 Tax=Lolium multiflorum TaxID=4521 RepID=A0AAD8WVH3_LOLMU|nr:hypothetical protein QYE76_043365 [Lolium multiflorum]